MKRTRRSQVDPSQLNFVFEGADAGVRTETTETSGTTGSVSVADLPLFAPEERPATIPGEGAGEEIAPRELDADPAESVSIRVEEPGREADTEMPDAVAAAYRAPVKLSGPDPGLTALCALWAKDLGMDELGRKLKVVWNRRFTSAAGVARYGPNRIELNPALVEFEGEIERTLKHELAHLVARARFPKKRIRPHGIEWRSACADLGIPGEPVYHSLPFKSRRRKREHAYQCASCSEVITRVRPLKGHCACYSCCKKYSGGRYDTRFKLAKVPVPKSGD